LDTKSETFNLERSSKHFALIEDNIMSVNLGLRYGWFFRISPITIREDRHYLICEHCGRTYDLNVVRCRTCDKKSFKHDVMSQDRTITRFDEMIEDHPEFKGISIDFAYPPTEAFMELGIYAIDDDKHVPIPKDKQEHYTNRYYEHYSRVITSEVLNAPPVLKEGVREQINDFMEKFRKIYGENSISLDYGILGYVS
jgi:hypothetical protein